MKALAARRLFVGTYTDGGASEGIYTVAFDEADGSTSVLCASTHAPNPSYVTVQEGTLFAAHELPDRSCLAAYRIRDDGSLVCRGACSSPFDAGTCFVAAHPSERCLYAANYLSGSIGACAVLPDGRLATGLPSIRHEGSGPNRERQESPHVHSLGFVPGTRLLAAVDLGIDAVNLYWVNESGAVQRDAVETVRVRPGSGPRLLAHHPRLPMAALVCELANNLVLFAFDEKGLNWSEVARLELPTCGDASALAAHVAYSADGRHLYASVRGSDRIAAFALDEAGLPVACADFSSGGRGPRHFSLSPDGRFLAAANQDSGNLALFAVDPAHGGLREAAQLDVPEPSCVVWG